MRKQKMDRAPRANVNAGFFLFIFILRMADFHPPAPKDLKRLISFPPKTVVDNKSSTIIARLLKAKKVNTCEDEIVYNIP